MLKRVIDVPKGIRYISEWKGFKLEDYPYILDKKIPGCGFTEWCITNDQPLVLCSPRRILLQNKFDQHKGEVYYFKNNYEKIVDVEKDLTKRDKRTYSSTPQVETAEEKEAKKKFYQEAAKNLLAYITMRESRGLPPKILVTYDSFHIVKDILKNKLLLYDYQIIIDEWQSLMTDCRFKPTTELSFSSQLHGLQKVCYVSATPMMEDYLDEINIFKFLPYVELDWGKLDPNRIVHPKLATRILTSIPDITSKIVNEYRSGNYTGKYVLDQNGNPVYIESKEAVIYVNSVNNITKIIKSNEIKPEEVNILVADTEENRKKIKKRLGKGFEIGKVPLKGQLHKMFTLCTRTVYLGADFYSTNARTFIISDANIETLAVDISLDLPQILGRQRLNINPWKNEATFYYNPITKGDIYDELKFRDFMNRKGAKTKNLLEIYLAVREKDKREDLAQKYESALLHDNYKDDYIAVNKKFNPVTMEYESVPVENELVRIAEKRAFDMQKIEYKDRFVVFNTLEKVTGGGDSSEDDKKIKEFFRIYDKLPDFQKKLKYLCESDLDPVFIKSRIFPNIKDAHFDEYYTVLGPERCKAQGYNTSRLKAELKTLIFSTEILDEEIYKVFKEGQKVSRLIVKQKLQDIYNLVGYSKKAKASDLEEYFEVKSTTVSDPIRTNGFELLKKLK